MPPAILLMGPTAGGKTALAVEIARRFPVEIISVDSAQVYRGMDLGTAKPAAAERAAVPHHLIDIIDPTESYSAAQFRADAARLMREVTGRGRIPLLAGGTMLYFKALREGLSNLPQADAAVRAAIEAEAGEKGWPALHAELACIDAPTAARLKPGDAQRIQRALEVFRVTGKPLSALQGARGRALAIPIRAAGAGAGRARALAPAHRVAFRSHARCGPSGEVAGLRRNYALNPRLPSMRCVGYRRSLGTSRSGV